MNYCNYDNLKLNVLKSSFSDTGVEQDLGPEEPNLSEYISADIFLAHCKTCKFRRIERKHARVHKPQTFRRP
jgi:hypothetical protein